MSKKKAGQVSRREFLKQGVKTGVVISAGPMIINSLLSGCSGLERPPVYQLTKDDLRKLLEVALASGGEFAEVYLEHRDSTRMSLNEDKIKSLNYEIMQGVGIRVWAGEEVGYAYTDDLSITDLEKTAKTAATIAKAGGKVKIADLTKTRPKRNISVITPLGTITEKKKIDLMWRANQTARDYDPHVKEVYVDYTEELKNVVIANSNGVWVEDQQPLSRFTVSVTAVDGEIRQSGFDSFSGRAGWEQYQEVKPEDLAKEASRQAVDMLKARNCPGGEMPVVMPKGWGGVLLHEAVGHGFEGDFVRKKTSVYTEMVGKPVASKLVTVIDDGTMENKRGTLNVDDEGTPAQRTVLIEEGICRGFLFDLFNAKLMNTKSTGNGRRQSFRYVPQPRMTNTVMQGGTSTIEDLVKNTDYGLYVSQLSGGSVDITSGHFVFNVTEAYMIEKGQKTYPVRGATLIGKGADILMKVDMVGPDVECGVGTCGKGGQGVPVCVGEPSLRISSMTVGGTKV